MSAAKKKKAVAHGKKTTRKAAAKKKAAKKKAAKKAPRRAETTKAPPAKKQASTSTSTKKASAAKSAKKAKPAKGAKKASAAKSSKKAKPAKSSKKAAPAKGAKKPSPPKSHKQASAPERKAPRRKSRAKSQQVPAVNILPRRAPIAAVEGADKLGTKWDCYSCDAKFYDLNKDDPICPKCGASQHDAPRTKAPAKRSASASKNPRNRRRMSPLLDDEDDTSYAPAPPDVDLGIANVNDDEGFVDSPPDAAIDEEDEEDEA